MLKVKSFNKYFEVEMKAKIRWNARHTIMLIIFVLVLLFVIFKDKIINPPEPKDLNRPANLTNKNKTPGPFAEYKKRFAAHRSDAYPVKKVKARDRSIFITVSVADVEKEYRMFGLKLSSDDEFNTKTIKFLEDYLKKKFNVVYLEAEEFTNGDSIRKSDSHKTNERHIFVDNPKFPEGEMKTWFIHLTSYLISKGLAYLEDKPEVTEYSLYAYDFYKYDKEAKKNKLGLYADKNAKPDNKTENDK